MVDIDPVRAEGVNEVLGGSNFREVEIIHQEVVGDKGVGLLSSSLVELDGMPGATLYYEDQSIGNGIGHSGLDAYLRAMELIEARSADLSFLIHFNTNAAAQAGGNLKETLNLIKRSEGNSGLMYKGGWDRLRKGIDLNNYFHTFKRMMAVVAIAGGLGRYGGSAEIPMMAGGKFGSNIAGIVADSRMSMCASELTIALMEGFGGIVNRFDKSNLFWAEYMALTAELVGAVELQKAGIIDEIVEIDGKFPSPNDKDTYKKHDNATHYQLFPAALRLVQNMQAGDYSNPKRVVGYDPRGSDFNEVVDRRSNPETYKHLWGKSVSEVQAELNEIGGLPLAPNSVRAIKDYITFLKRFADKKTGETTVNLNPQVLVEAKRDAELYRHPNLKFGIEGVMGQKDGVKLMQGEKPIGRYVVQFVR